MGTMAMMTERDGDLKVHWDPAKEAEVQRARETFDAMREKGYSAYQVEEGGGRGELIRRFDPAAEAILMAPRMVGG